MTSDSSTDRFEPLSSYRELPLDEMIARAAAFADEMNRRRTTRQFSDRPIPIDVIEHSIRAAGTAPMP